VAGDFYGPGINRLIPRPTKCIAFHGDYVEKKRKVRCKFATSESKNKMLYKCFLVFASIFSE
jgi:hypothetical protein